MSGAEGLPPFSGVRTVEGVPTGDRRPPPEPVLILEGAAYALDNGEEDLAPLLPEDRRTLGSIVEFMVNSVRTEGL